MIHGLEIIIILGYNNILLEIILLCIPMGMCSLILKLLCTPSKGPYRLHMFVIDYLIFESF